MSEVSIPQETTQSQTFAVPELKTLRELVMKDKETKIQKYTNYLQERILKFDEVQEKLEGEQLEKFNDFNLKLKTACDTYTEELSQEIIKVVTDMIEKQHNNRSIWNFTPTDTCGFSVRTLQYGLWNRKTNKHSPYRLYYAWGKQILPFQFVQNKFKENGYLLTDITDTNKSRNLVLKIELQQ
jgi:hypothetical protein